MQLPHNDQPLPKGVDDAGSAIISDITDRNSAESPISLGGVPPYPNSRAITPRLLTMQTATHGHEHIIGRPQIPVNEADSLSCSPPVWCSIKSTPTTVANCSTII